MQRVPTQLIVIEDEDGQGPAWARNRGLEVADTRYVAFLDADDRWWEDKLKRQLLCMDETGAGLCIEGKSMTLEEFLEELLVGGLSSIMSSMVLNTTVVDARFDEDLERLEDYLFAIEVALEADVCFCEDLVEIRKHDEGLSSRGDAELKQRNRLRFADRLKALPIPNNLRRRYLREAYYRAGADFKKERKFREALLSLLQSAFYGSQFRQLTAIAGIPLRYFLE